MGDDPERRLRIVEVTEATVHHHLAASAAAMRDFLYLFFDIAGDCLPHGDFARADRGSTDPLPFVDIDYRYRYQVRSQGEIDLLHRGAAVSIIARLTDIGEADDDSGSTLLADFAADPYADDHPLFDELTPLHEVFTSGHVVDEPSIQAALHAAFHQPHRLHDHTQAVLEQVIRPTFERPGAPLSGPGSSAPSSGRWRGSGRTGRRSGRRGRPPRRAG